jgi:ankyrin repeat protein
MSAAYRGDTFMIDLLLKYGADPSLKDKNGLTAYDIALKEKKTFAAELLREK